MLLNFWELKVFGCSCVNPQFERSLNKEENVSETLPRAGVQTCHYINVT